MKLSFTTLAMKFSYIFSNFPVLSNSILNTELELDEKLKELFNIEKITLIDFLNFLSNGRIIFLKDNKYFHDGIYPEDIYKDLKPVVKFIEKYKEKNERFELVDLYSSLKKEIFSKEEYLGASFSSKQQVIYFFGHRYKVEKNDLRVSACEYTIYETQFKKIMSKVRRGKIFY